jgi:cyclase
MMVPSRRCAGDETTTMQLRTVALLAACCAAASAAAADSVETRETRARQIGDGIHVIRHADATADFPEGNTTVVIGTRGVLVVDTGYLPSTARADIARIRAWTDRPVRWVVNTHWHNDHVGGNAVYLQAFPGAEVVAHPETRDMIEGRIPSYLVRYVAPDSAFAAQRERWRRIAETGVDVQGQSVTDARRTEASDALRRAERAAAEFREATVQVPTVTVDGTLRIDLGGRVVELRHLGRGNTGGDVVVVLPQERIVVAGDLLTHPVPYAFGGYPTEWIATLRRLASLDADTIVPGHGDVLQGTGYLRRVAALLEHVRSQVAALLDARGSALTVDEAQRAIDLAAERRAFAGDDAANQAFFDASMASLIRVLHAEGRAR